MDLLPMWRELADDLAVGASPSYIAGRFHAGLVDMFVQGLCRVAARTGLDRVVLSGGSFYNRYLLSQLQLQLAAKGLRVYSHQQVPTGDGGLALGQAIIASEVSG